MAGAGLEVFEHEFDKAVFGTSSSTARPITGTLIR